jgi:hypothetical protein
MSKKNPVIEVHTNKRSYTHLGDPGKRVVWQKGEKIVSAEAKDRPKGGKK